MNPDYTPISCSAYDVLEASAVKKAILRIDFLTSEGVIASRTVTVRDLFSKDRAEFLVAVEEESGNEFSLRLDKIQLITDLATKTVYSPNVC